jgi:poly(3-hydroxybutyrate) depolymerase
LARILNSNFFLKNFHLEPYAIEPGSLTVSGISAGAAMASQFHVAFSKDVNGVGIFAGSMKE